MKYVILAMFMSGCIPGWQQLSPEEAYGIESRSCEKKPDTEARRQCQALVDRKYGRYLSEGAYPGGVSGCSAPQDCRGR